MGDDDTPLLEELNVRTIRAKNDQVDEELTDLEEQVSTLRDDLAEKKAEVEQVEKEKEAATKLLEQFRDSRRSEHLDRIKAANEAVSDDDEVDIGPLEEADVDTLEWVADRMETLAANAADDGVSNTGSGPDFGNVDPSDVNTDDSVEEQMAEVASELNMETQFQKLKSGEFGSPARMSTNEGDASEKLQSALEDVIGGDA